MNLLKLAQTVAANPGDVEIHPHYSGFMTRSDGWSSRAFQHGPDWSLLYFLEKGEINTSYHSQKMTLTPGDSLFIGKDAHPDLRFSNPIELREVWFRFKPGSNATNRYAALDQMIRFQTPVEADSLIDHLSSEMQTGGPQQVTVMRLSLLLALCGQEILREEDAGRKLSPSQRVRLVRWVRENLAARPSPARAAHMLGLSPDYFGRLFRNTFGQAPRDWLIRQRILTARRLLDDGRLSISEVMKQCGFDDQTHFSRQMKRLTGKTPLGSRGWKQNPHKKGPASV